MKLISVILLLVLNIGFSSTRWSNTNVGDTYRLNKPLVLQANSKSITLPKGSRVKLVESADLDMIKVNLQRYEIDGCNVKNVETDLELIPSSKSKEEPHSVGVNLSKGCILEVFIEKKDAKEESFFI